MYLVYFLYVFKKNILEVLLKNVKWTKESSLVTHSSGLPVK